MRACVPRVQIPCTRVSWTSTHRSIDRSHLGAALQQSAEYIKEEVTSCIFSSCMVQSHAGRRGRFGRSHHSKTQQPSTGRSAAYRWHWHILISCSRMSLLCSLASLFHVISYRQLVFPGRNRHSLPLASYPVQHQQQQTSSPLRHLSAKRSRHSVR
jgi:hypothetical protein